MPAKPDASSDWKISHLVVAQQGSGDDRIVVVHVSDGFVLAVVDGAGGLGKGTQAADEAARQISIAARERAAQKREWCSALLAQIDAGLSRTGGECALVIAYVSGTQVAGASVGDCTAWLVGDALDELTANQRRKPLVGSGQAKPVPFEARMGDATLLMASDGLWKYAPRDRISEHARRSDLESAASRIAALPRLRSGALPDDVAVLLCRRRQA